MSAPKRFLVIRRDNIGDLVCTTPVFTALRRKFPDAHICALVNSYNLPVLERNPDIDEVFAYTKAKHRPPGTSVARIYWQRLRLIARLRGMRFDYAILAAPGFLPKVYRLARLIRPAHMVGFITSAMAPPDGLDIAVPDIRERPMHETEAVFRILAPLGIDGPPPPQTVVAKSAVNAGAAADAPVIGLHISARKPSQRWPEASFVALARQLRAKYGARFMLFWSPGDESNPLHPGDDAKAAEIIRELGEFPLAPYPTRELGELIEGLSQCSAVICSDGGAMHIAAALRKPTLCFFGKSDASRWYPWGVPYVLLQPDSREVRDIGIEQAAEACGQLTDKVRSGELRAE